MKFRNPTCGARGRRVGSITLTAVTGGAEAAGLRGAERRVRARKAEGGHAGAALCGEAANGRLHRIGGTWRAVVARVARPGSCGTRRTQAAERALRACLGVAVEE